MSFDVTATVTAESVGEEVYDAHAAGIQKVAAAADGASVSTAGWSSKVAGARSALMGMHLSILAVQQGMHLFGVQNEALTKALDAMVVGLTIARTALAVYRAAQESVTLANWARAASEVAASAWFAPVLIGIIVATVGALLAYEAGILKFAAGGEMLVTGPRVFLAGEGGPERVTVTPVTGAAPGGAMIGPVHITVVTADPEAAGRAVADYLLRLKSAGR